MSRILSLLSFGFLLGIVSEESFAREFMSFGDPSFSQKDKISSSFTEVSLGTTLMEKPLTLEAIPFEGTHYTRETEEDLKLSGADLNIIHYFHLGNSWKLGAGLNGFYYSGQINDTGLASKNYDEIELANWDQDSFYSGYGANVSIGYLIEFSSVRVIPQLSYSLSQLEITDRLRYDFEGLPSTTKSEGSGYIDVPESYDIKISEKGVMQKISLGALFVSRFGLTSSLNVGKILLSTTDPEYTGKIVGATTTEVDDKIDEQHDQERWFASLSIGFLFN